jgi:hypothetical protein
VSLNDCSLLNFLIMKKSILNLGKALNRAEQKQISGGVPSLSCYGKSAGNSCGRGRICCSSNQYSGNDSQNPYLYCAAEKFCQGPGEAEM